MEKQKTLGEIHMMGVEEGTYEQLAEIAKKQGKSVVDVASEALKAHIDSAKKLNESKEKRLLMEG